MAKQAVARVASSEVAKILSSAVMSKKFHFKDGVWYASHRLQKQGALDVCDLDFSLFYDSHDINKVLPVMLVKSNLFLALL
jgi:hypothetical protein